MMKQAAIVTKYAADDAVLYREIAGHFLTSHPYRKCKSALYGQPQYDAVKKWQRRMMAMVMLPPDLLDYAWDHVISNVPVTGEWR